MTRNATIIAAPSMTANEAKAIDYRIFCRTAVRDAKAALVAQQARPFADFDASMELELERQVRHATSRLFHAL